MGTGGTFTMSSEDHDGLKASDLVMHEIEGGMWVFAE